MQRRIAVELPALAAACVSLLLLGTEHVAAQAWVAPAGSGAATLGLQWIDNTGHVLSDGSSDTDHPGGSHDASIFLGVEYAFTDRLSVEVGIPYVFAKFVGPGETPMPFLPVDSCYCWHGGFQDFGVTVRYNAIGEIGGAFQLTPSVTFGTPSHDYVYQGEAVVGRNLKEGSLALDVGQRLDAISPRLSIQGRYAYTFVEKVLDVSTNRSNFSLEVDFLLSRRLLVRGLAYWQWTHGGLRVPADIVEHPIYGPEHDRLLRNDYFHAGAGLSYQFPSFDVYATYLGFASGRNTHQGWAASWGVSVPFEIGGSGAP